MDGYQRFVDVDFLAICWNGIGMICSQKLIHRVQWKDFGTTFTKLDIIKETTNDMDIQNNLN